MVVARSEPRDIVHELSRQLVTAGLGTRVVFHGSSAWGAMSSVRSEVGLLLVSDVDMFASDALSELECCQVAADLQRTFSAAAGVTAPGARISVKRAGHELSQYVEGRSLVLSALRGGRTAMSVYRCGWPSSASRPRVEYPFALHYAYLRWLSWAGRGPEWDVAALYELAKGCRRSLLGDDCRAVSDGTHSERSLRSYLLSVLPAFRNSVLGVGWTTIFAWLRFYGRGTCVVSSESRNAALNEFTSLATRHWPKSLLLHRLRAQLHA
jgi:hypothetical protein